MLFKFVSFHLMIWSTLMLTARNALFYFMYIRKWKKKRTGEGERESERETTKLFALPMFEHTLSVTLIFDVFDSTTEILYTYVFHIDSMRIVGFLHVSLNQLVLSQVYISMWSIECIFLLLLLLLLTSAGIFANYFNRIRDVLKLFSTLNHIELFVNLKINIW